MERISLWKQKVIQFFHDPPGKPFVIYPGAGGHKKVGRDLFEKATGVPLNRVNPAPDWAASGADRGVYPSINFNQVWYKEPLITHPLHKGGIYMDLRAPHKESLDRKLAQVEAKDAPMDMLDPKRGELADADFEWQDLTSLQQGYLIWWRRFRDLLQSSAEANTGELNSTIWAEMPAETRQPDHSVWDHVRMAAALAFVERQGEKRKRDPQNPRAPWLLRLSLSPVQGYIREARTSRDLWTGSFMLADLAWHAMAPVVEYYGPDALLYPDLRGNPLVDHYLIAKELFGIDKKSLLGEESIDPCSYASLLPASFTALVPRGGAGDLISIEDLAEKCNEALQARWRALADIVERWLKQKDRFGQGHWQKIWQRQVINPPVRLRWSAVPWLHPGELSGAQVLMGGPLFPFEKTVPKNVSEKDREVVNRLRQWYRDWTPDSLWYSMVQTRLVFARTNVKYLNNERGFDYPLVHHQLLARDGLLKRQAAVDLISNQEEPGVKCTLCGRRQALANSDIEYSLGRQKEEVLELWKKLDPDGLGHEHLCGPCAVKRYAVAAGEFNGHLDGINPAWAGAQTKLDEVKIAGEVRVPFPSTATIAAQKFIEAVVREPRLASERKAVILAHKKAGLKATTFPAALPRLATLQKAGEDREFLIREAEETLFPQAMEALADQPGLDDERREAFLELAQAINHLRSSASHYIEDPKLKNPDPRYAVIKLDGDAMGRLISGDPEVIGAHWKDILHPGFLEKLKEWDKENNAGWSDLLKIPRAIGPALHAFVTRTLAEFQHRVVPWVVEQEFSGRLIYSGGDDILCLAPAEEALDLATRLQQIFSAPWILDTRPDEPAWAWRHGQAWADHDPEQARSRFVVLNGNGDEPLRHPFKGLVLPHPADGRSPKVKEKYRLLPMLGGGQSLSAGIAFGHYKTPLRMMLDEAGRLLDRWAKEKAGRSAIAMAHVTRGGVKNRFAMRWDDHAHAVFRRVIEGFESGEISGRLPYRLRELAAAFDGVERNAKEERRQLALALFNKASSGQPHPAAKTLWLQGIELCRAGYEGEAVQGLLLCRALANGGENAPDGEAVV